MYKITFFVPVTHVDSVKTALFAAGAGRIGDYDACAWQVLGVGQFRPLPGANPFLGEVGAIETVAEYRVELVCADDCLKAAVAALRASHPYEEPAYDVVHLVDI
ncbi:MAG: YqfO family protein [Fluviicoccus sp.]|uniref:Nif3-like dinuclear metal center hexameric protein n=1 Tax=Fluviicoccus sp. TaxID=2003552 RepID=UPI00271C1380|nr:YqfO family protein [Fluviicoccus sp.]MDO8331515.1 YqfO family protein [Fluviicoccus sp.]